MLENEYEGLNARPKVYLSKEYFCKMYPTCVSSKLCKFIFFLTHALVPCGPFVVIYVPKVHGDIPPSLMVLFATKLTKVTFFWAVVAPGDTGTSTSAGGKASTRLLVLCFVVSIQGSHNSLLNPNPK